MTEVDTSRCICLKSRGLIGRRSEDITSGEDGKRWRIIGMRRWKFHVYVNLKHAAGEEAGSNFVVNCFRPRGFKSRRSGVVNEETEIINSLFSPQGKPRNSYWANIFKNSTKKFEKSRHREGPKKNRKCTSQKMSKFDKNCQKISP